MVFSTPEEKIKRYPSTTSSLLVLTQVSYNDIISILLSFMIWTSTCRFVFSCVRSRHHELTLICQYWLGEQTVLQSGEIQIPRWSAASGRRESCRAYSIVSPGR